MNLYNAVKQFIVGFLTGLFGILDDEEDLKPERIQFWDGVIHPDWRQMGTALVRTIPCADATAAADLVKTIAGELARYRYVAATLKADGNVVTVRLTSNGKVTERDYAAAALIDLVV